MKEEGESQKTIVKEFADVVTQNLVDLVGVQAVRIIFAREFSKEKISFSKEGKIRFESEDVIATTKQLTMILVDRAIKNFGYEFSEQVLHEAYDILKEKHGAEAAIFLIFDIVPEGSMEKERIRFLSKEELERRVLDRTRELQETNANLEKTVTDRTKELVMANYKLKKAIKDLEDLNKMKSEFLSLASHQMRSPLTASTWSLERLKELFEKSSSVGEENKKLLEEALSRNQRVARLIDNLLNISRVEAGRFFQKFEAVSLQEIVQNSIDAVPPIEERNLVAIEYKSPKERFIVMADKTKLTLAVENVIDNAVKYSPAKAKVEVTILGGPDNVTVRVKDQGIGIPKNEQENVFGKFFRAQNAQHNDIPGSGLGLYLAKKIIEGHGGYMSFESEEKKGTTFFMQLPLVGKEGTKEKKLAET